MITDYYYIPYECPNTGLEMLIEERTGIMLIRFRGMHAELSKRRVRNMLKRYLMAFTKRQLINASPLEIVEWFREELIAQCVADWIKAK